MAVNPPTLSATLFLATITSTSIQSCVTRYEDEAKKKNKCVALARAGLRHRSAPPTLLLPPYERAPTHARRLFPPTPHPRAHPTSHPLLSPPRASALQVHCLPH